MQRRERPDGRARINLEKTRLAVERVVAEVQRHREQPFGDGGNDTGRIVRGHRAAAAERVPERELEFRRTAVRRAVGAQSALIGEGGVLRREVCGEGHDCGQSKASRDEKRSFHRLSGTTVDSSLPVANTRLL